MKFQFSHSFTIGQNDHTILSDKINVRCYNGMANSKKSHFKYFVKSLCNPDTAIRGDYTIMCNSSSVMKYTLSNSFKDCFTNHHRNLSLSLFPSPQHIWANFLKGKI